VLEVAFWAATRTIASQVSAAVAKGLSTKAVAITFAGPDAPPAGTRR